MRRYKDRAEAGQRLAPIVARAVGTAGAVVLGLPRGGVAVAAPVAERLGAPLDVLVVRKLGLPHYPELAMGALASGGITVRNEDVLAMYPVTDAEFAAVADAEGEELRRREQAYRDDADPPCLAGRVAVLVDDGIATGATVRAAVAACRQRNAARVLVAAPVASRAAAAAVREVADELITLDEPAGFLAVGASYERFPQLTDADVRALLPERAAAGG